MLLRALVMLFIMGGLTANAANIQSNDAADVLAAANAPRYCSSIPRHWQPLRSARLKTRPCGWPKFRG